MGLQKQPSQSKKIFTIWSHIGSNNGLILENQSFFYQTADRDMKRIIADFTQCLKEENRYLEKQLIKIGIKPTQALTVHSKAKIKPIRARISNTDISASLSMNIATSLVTTSTALSEAISESNIMRYAHIHMKKAIIGAKLIELSNKKKWLPSPTITQEIKSR